MMCKLVRIHRQGGGSGSKNTQAQKRLNNWTDTGIHRPRASLVSIPTPHGEPATGLIRLYTASIWGRIDP